MILGVLGHDHGGHGHSHGGSDETKNHAHSHDDHSHHAHSHDDHSHHAHSHDDHSHHAHSHDDHSHHDHSHDDHSHDDHSHDDHTHDMEKQISDELSYQKQHLVPKKVEHQNINVTAAYIHAIGDLLQSVGVCIAGALIWMYPGDKYPMVQLADPLATFLFSILVLYSTYQVLRSSMNVLMEGVPEGLDPRLVANGLLAIEGVVGLHHLHIWSVTVGMPSLSVHLLVDEDSDMFQVLKRAQHVFRDNHIEHSTVQIEHRDKTICGQQDCIGDPCDSYALSCADQGEHCFDHSGN